MPSPLDKLHHSVISQQDLLTPLDGEWESLSESPRYTLDDLLSQCDATAPEMDEVINWQNSKRAGREE